MLQPLNSKLHYCEYLIELDGGNLGYTLKKVGSRWMVFWELCSLRRDNHPKKLWMSFSKRGRAIAALRMIHDQGKFIWKDFGWYYQPTN